MSGSSPSVRVILLLVIAAFTVAVPAAADTQCATPVLSLDDLRAWARATSDGDHLSHLRAARALAAAQSPGSGPGGSFAFRAAIARLTLQEALPWEAGHALAAEDDRWLPGFGLPILDQYPLTAIEYRGELVIGGYLSSAGGLRVWGMARWTDDGWDPLGQGMSALGGLAVLNGLLIAASGTGSISAWDGNAWTALPPAPLDRVYAIAARDGKLYAAGSRLNRYPARQWGQVARFDGLHWTVLGGEFDQRAHALGFYRGDLIAGGSFTRCGTTDCAYVARWDGTSWTALGAGIDRAQFANVSAIEEYEGRLVVGGWFGAATPGLAAWDGATWAPLAGVPVANVQDLLVMDGRLYIAGAFAGESMSVAFWDGSAFHSTPDPLGCGALGLARYRGRLAAVGTFTWAGRCPATRPMVGVAVMDPDGWHGIERWDADMHGFTSAVHAGSVESMAEYRGELIVAGFFCLGGDPAGWKSLPGIARWDGRSWQRIGEGFSCLGLALEVVGEDLVAAGFVCGWSPEGPMNGAARWDGVRWHAMGQGLGGLVFALAEYRGQLYAGGEMQVLATGEPATLAVWDGVEWSAVPGAPNAASINTPRISALEVKDGVLYAGGNFDGSATIASPGVVAWDGQRWRAVGAVVRGDVLALSSYRGELYAGGWVYLGDDTWDGLARWDGTSWHPMGLHATGVRCLTRYGEKLVVGGYDGVGSVVPGSSGLKAWDGERWSGFGAGMNNLPMALLQVGSDLVVGGMFNRAGDRSSFGIARWAGGARPVPATPVRPARGELLVRSTVATGDRADLSYSLPEAGHARLDVFDVRGARIASLLDHEMPAGDGVLEWSAGAPVPLPATGIYFLRLTLNDRAATARVVFVR